MFDEGSSEYIVIEVLFQGPVLVSDYYYFPYFPPPFHILYSYFFYSQLYHLFYHLLLREINSFCKI